MPSFGFGEGEAEFQTYDGLPVAENPPHGATVVVSSEAPEGRRYLVLHRAHDGPDHEGDWAWTPPAGARLPGEDLFHCASRELEEETGLRGAPTLLTEADAPWAVFELELPWRPHVVLDEEHDRFEWVTFEEACARCLPNVVADAVKLSAGRHR
jgi:8-oxo-dGTP pyrophosphatase MutT (NUDIX family)